MNIGLRGSYAYKLPRLWWKSPDAFPARHLHLNILAEAEENEAGMRHDVRFLTRREAERRDENHCWYRVGEILNAQDAVDLNDFLVDRELANRRGPFRVLAGLHKAVHTEPVIAYYQEEDQGLDKVLDIFIRTNSGGTTLSYSDMLMSMATAQWENLDAREAIHGTIAEINRIGDGFGFSQDFLLKAGLMLAGVGSVQFEVREFQSQEYEASRGSLGIPSRTRSARPWRWWHGSVSPRAVSAQTTRSCPSRTTYIVETLRPDSCLMSRTGLPRV